MKLLILVLTVFFTTLFTYGQDDKSVNFLSGIKNYNISELWTTEKFQTEYERDTSWIKRSEPLGYIGENYQRFYIHFISVIQNPNNKLEYMVFGKTKVKTNICTFQGVIRIEKAFTYQGEEAPDIKQGYVIGNYEFYEDSQQKGSGIFKGKFESDFYINKRNQITYNAFSFGADGFENNQFEGTWTSYISKEAKKCNWGDYRIPDSKELDSGAGEFGPNSKYEQNGWENYSIMMGAKRGQISEEEAHIIENTKWWIDK